MTERTAANSMWHALSNQHDQILLWMREERMTDTHQIEMWVVNNAGLPVSVTGISMSGPDLLVFSTRLRGGATYILQHPHQVNVTFNVVKVDGAPTKLGFVQSQPPAAGQSTES